MAYKVELSDGAAVVDLAGGVHYRVLPNGVLHGPPPVAAGVRRRGDVGGRRSG